MRALAERIWAKTRILPSMQEELHNQSPKTGQGYQFETVTPVRSDGPTN